ncbi:hypothetical protein EBR96_01205 [bacterium]|nr:hypothetical protein [bacterium]
MTGIKGGLTSEYSGAALWLTGNAWKRQAAAALRGLNVTYVQFMVLRAVGALCETQAIVSQVEVANALHSNPMVVSAVVRALKKQRLLSVRIHPRDSRAKRVDITQAGKEILKTGHELMLAIEDQFFKAIGSQNRAFKSDLTTLAASHPFVLNE